MSNEINFTTFQPKTSSGFSEDCSICLNPLIISNEDSSLSPVSFHISSTQAIPKLSSSTKEIPKLTELILSRFPCHAFHAFHEKCLNRWFREKPDNPFCPLCKRPVMVVREKQPSNQAVANIAMPALGQHDRWEVVNRLLTGELPPGVPLPNQEEINRAFADAAQHGRWEVVNRLLTGELLPGVPRPNQEGINDVFAFAAQYGHLAVVNRLLTGELPPGVPRPNQEGINRAFAFAVQYSRLDVVNRLLTGELPPGVSR